MDAASEGVDKFVLECKTEIVGVDWREIQIYLASNMDSHTQKTEKIEHLLPRRPKTKGRRPGQRTKELRQRAPDLKDPDSKPKPSLWEPSNPDI